jgi:hypothetical protein
MTEEWRPIPGIDGYMASSHGRIKSLSRKTFNGKGYFISKEKIYGIKSGASWSAV